MTSRQAELIGWAMSAWSLTRPSASRVARSSSSLPPHWLQKRARRWFLHPQEVQRSVSFRLGIATNEPLVPSMIFRSRTTKASSNVTEQNAWRRSFSLLSSMSLMRTSVITTAVLLCVCGTSNATPNQEQFEPIPGVGAGGGPPLRDGTKPAGDPQRLALVAAQGEHGAAAAAHQHARRPEGREPLPQAGDLIAEAFGRGLEPVVQPAARLLGVAGRHRRPDLRA